MSQSVDRLHWANKIMTPEQHPTLSGGNSNRVTRQGNTVIRHTGPWSPFVHQLLRHLAQYGFKEAPVVLETTDKTEHLTFLDGEAGNDTLKPYMQTAGILVEAAQLLRRFHDITQEFVIAPDSVFQLPVHPDLAWDVICHNDFAPYNCIFKNNHLIGLIDFDTAGPGTRLWDIAYAVYRFVPLATDEHCRNLGWSPIPDRSLRLTLFCEAYGLDNQAARGALIATVIERLDALIAHIRQTSSTLEHIPLYERDLAYIRANQSVFSRALQ